MIWHLATNHTTSPHVTCWPISFPHHITSSQPHHRNTTSHRHTKRLKAGAHRRFSLGGICFYEKNFRSQISRNMSSKAQQRGRRERSRREKKAELEERRYRCAKCQASFPTSFKSNDLWVGGRKVGSLKRRTCGAMWPEEKLMIARHCGKKTHLQVLYNERGYKGPYYEALRQQWLAQGQHMEE